MTYKIGSLARVTSMWTDVVTGDPVDPTTVILMVQKPDGTDLPTPSITHPIVGTYYSDIDLEQAGVYKLRWVGTGSAQGAQEGSLLVDAPTLVPPQPTDLVTIQQVTQWIPVTDLNDLNNLQILISSASIYWLWRLGLTTGGGGIPTESPLVQPVVLDEWYDGGGGSMQFVRISPIQSVQALAVDGVSIPASTGPTASGYWIHQNRKAIIIRGGAGPGFGFGRRGLGGYRSNYVGRFSYGLQNVNIQYTAGYTLTPYDIVEKTIEMVVLNFKRRDWVDQKANAKPDTIGSITYRDWELPPGIQSVIDNYSRKAIV